MFSKPKPNQLLLLCNKLFKQFCRKKILLSLMVAMISRWLGVWKPDSNLIAKSERYERFVFSEERTKATKSWSIQTIDCLVRSSEHELTPKFD